MIADEIRSYRCIYSRRSAGMREQPCPFRSRTTTAPTMINFRCVKRTLHLMVPRSVGCTLCTIPGA